MQMDELSPRMKELMQEILPQLKEFIVAKANAEFKTDRENIDFVLSVGTNLLGNLVWQACDNDFEKLQALAHITLNNLISWFASTISYEKTKKDMH